MNPLQKNFIEYHKLPVIVRAFIFRVGSKPFPVTLGANELGLVQCRIGESDLRELAADAPGDEPHGARVILEAAAGQLAEYFAGNLIAFTIPLMPRGTDFQLQVWQATCQIPYGQTRSYWWVAVRMGNPYATRAVGGALGANPLPLFIPCHRVVRHDGTFGGFRPGPEWKQLLLEHEQRHRDKLYEIHWPTRHP
ncbi:MAG: methylated-DNA--[protein]-cysteine S-methyltransferase [Candidatus Sumerlaeaceae bacterium]